MADLINGRTPEEIKRGLIVCSKYIETPEEECADCPYGIKGSPVCAINILMQDSLAYVERLETKLARQDELLAVMGVRVPEEEG